jgi:hypothetical protein
VVRIVNADIANPRVTISGLTAVGTATASVCLQEPTCVDEIVRQAPKDWPSENIEVVIATQMIDGQPGPSRVLAVEGLKSRAAAFPLPDVHR